MCILHVMFGDLVVSILSTVFTCLCGMVNPFMFALADLEPGDNWRSVISKVWSSWWQLIGLGSSAYFTRFIAEKKW